jgi:hypothetical protein
MDPELCRKVVDWNPIPVGHRQFRYLCRRETALLSPSCAFSGCRRSETATALFQHNGMKLGNLGTDLVV